MGQKQFSKILKKAALISSENFPETQPCGTPILVKSPDEK